MLITDINYHKVIDFSDWSFSDSTRIICCAIRDQLLKSVSGLRIYKLLDEYRIRVSLRELFYELDLKSVVGVFLEECTALCVNVSPFCGNDSELSFLHGRYYFDEDSLFSFHWFNRLEYCSSGGYLDVLLNKEHLPLYLHCPCLESFTVPSFNPRCKIVFDKPVDFIPFTLARGI